eukprot:scaffold659843_cov43-Prasinocladus_malaysianus.AAC.1
MGGRGGLQTPVPADVAEPELPIVVLLLAIARHMRHHPAAVALQQEVVVVLFNQPAAMARSLGNRNNQARSHS